MTNEYQPIPMDPLFHPSYFQCKTHPSPNVFHGYPAESNTKLACKFDVTIQSEIYEINSLKLNQHKQLYRLNTDQVKCQVSEAYKATSQSPPIDLCQTAESRMNRRWKHFTSTLKDSKQITALQSLAQSPV